MEKNQNIGTKVHLRQNYILIVAQRHQLKGVRKSISHKKPF